MHKIFKRSLYVIPTLCAVVAFASILSVSANSPTAKVETIAVLSGVLAEMDEEALTEHSTLVIRGDVIGKSDAFQIQPATGGDPSNFTDYYVSIDEVLRGESAKPEDVITVRIQGGIANGLEVIAEEAAQIDVNDNVLLYLQRPAMGSGYNTEADDYYYVTGERQGAFIQEETKAIRAFSTQGSDEEIFVNEDEELVYDEVVETIAEFTEANPVDEDIVHDEFITNLQKNLKSGFITQEEYDQFILDSQEYATVVDD